jgi:phosphoribosylanthranilate isomerase
MAKIKICGLSRPVDIDYVNEAQPDYIGFVFAKSRRQVSEELAGKLKSMLNPAIQSVGVFVNEDVNRIIRLCREKVIDVIQLHGDEGEEYIQSLKEQVTNPIIKAVRVQSAKDIRKADLLSCDYLLLDAFKEGQYGGCGDVFDWLVISEVSKPYFLAGGIRPDNVIQAVAQVKPYAIDLSSGVETDGVKDRTKIIELITKVRSVR